MQGCCWTMVMNHASLLWNEEWGGYLCKLVFNTDTEDSKATS